MEMAYVIVAATVSVDRRCRSLGEMTKWKEVIKLRLRLKLRHDSHEFDCSFRIFRLAFIRHYADASSIRFISIFAGCGLNLIAAKTKPCRLDRCRPTGTE